MVLKYSQCFLLNNQGKRKLSNVLLHLFQVFGEAKPEAEGALVQNARIAYTWTRRAAP